ncbi:MAG: LuxR C-terminal-related transcriptional regulator [Galbitalea sp.]
MIDRAIERHPELSATLAYPRSVLLLNLENAALSELALDAATPGPDADESERADFQLARGLPLAALGRGDQALEAARAAVGHSTESLQPAFPLRRAQMVLETVLLQLGSLEEARDIAARSLQACIEHDDELGMRYNELLLGQCYLGFGQLATSARWFSDVISGSQARGSVFYLDQARCQRRGASSRSRCCGADERARRPAFSPTSTRRSSPRARSRPSRRSGSTPCAGGGSGRPRPCCVARGAAADRGHVIHSASLLHAAARLGAAGQAAPALTALAAGSASALLRAQAAHAAAEASSSLDALTKAGERWESLGYLLFAAEAYVSASAAARRDHDSRVAVSLQNRADDALARCEGAETPLLQFAERGERLTGREREIAALAAQGLSSLEIAKRLQVSPRTVNNHLHAAYAKLGVRGARRAVIPDRGPVR